MSNARNNILARLRANKMPASSLPVSEKKMTQWNADEKVSQLTQQMTAVRTEVHQLNNETWLDWIKRELPQRGSNRILIGEHQTTQALIREHDKGLVIQTYDRDIEHWKHQLFNEIDVSITTTLGAIAETGSLILWPDASEPRLMSLVPPVHIALLNKNQIYATFSEALSALEWSENNPTNALLISGPSKTSDIEQTLAYGIHGPQQLIVLIIDQ